MQVPTYEGVRRWRIVYRPRAGWTVQSLYSQSIWFPGQRLVAWCNRSQSQQLCPNRIGFHHCGVWACSSIHDMQQQRAPDYYIEGRVHLFGQVYDEGWGARAESGLPVAFWLLPQFRYPSSLVSYLRSFGVPVTRRS